MRVTTNSALGFAALGLAAFASVPGCAMPPAPPPDAARCEALSRRYDQLAELFPTNNWGQRDHGPMIPGPVSQQINRVIAAGCLTSSDDLLGMEARASDPALRAGSVSGGAAIPPTAVQAGILTSLTDLARAEAFFSALGYRTRSLGAERLGRRLFIGPFTSEAALQHGIETARAAGFVAPYASDTFRFWAF